MKKETTRAMAESIAQRSRETRTPQEHRARMAGLTNKLRDQKGPSISASELARIVELRLRKKNEKSNSTPAEIVEEIEATLDLVEMCEIVMEYRRPQWAETVSNISDAVHSDGEPSELEKGINAATYPMSFTAGLIKMGVPEKGREDKYWDFFKDQYPRWLWVKSCTDRYSQSVEDYTAIHPIPAGEIEQAFEKEKKMGWPDKWTLGNMADQWKRWWAIHKSDGQRLGGRRAVESKAKAKNEKAKLPQKPRSVKRPTR